MNQALRGKLLLGKYRVERTLGTGGMGVVVAAHDTHLDRPVAIKLLLPELARHPDALSRFLREARAAAKIQSEHVARVIEVGTLDDGAPVIVMEYLEGSDLSQVIDAGGPLPIVDAASYVIQACEALAEAHAQGIVHRDLKPANLFLAEQAGGTRKVKLLDFGVSKTPDLEGTRAAQSLTHASTMMGSPLYMSPEQVKSARDVDQRSDIWALGVILHEALTGTTPFVGDSIPEITARILLEQPPSLSACNPAVPAALADVVAKALRKPPALRFQNVGELALALLPFAQSRSKIHVERILRVLAAAGLGQADFMASLAPGVQARFVTDDVRLLGVAPASALGMPGIAPLAKPEGTLSNFGHTQTEPATRRGTRRLAGALASMGLVLALGGALFRATSSPDASPRAAAAAAPATRSARSSEAAPLPAPELVTAPTPERAADSTERSPNPAVAPGLSPVVAASNADPSRSIASSTRDGTRRGADEDARTPSPARTARQRANGARARSVPGRRPAPR